MQLLLYSLSLCTSFHFTPSFFSFLSLTSLHLFSSLSVPLSTYFCLSLIVPSTLWCLLPLFHSLFHSSSLSFLFSHLFHWLIKKCIPKCNDWVTFIFVAEIIMWRFYLSVLPFSPKNIAYPLTINSYTLSYTTFDSYPQFLPSLLSAFHLIPKPRSNLLTFTTLTNRHCNLILFLVFWSCEKRGSWDIDPVFFPQHVPGTSYIHLQYRYSHF